MEQGNDKRELVYEFEAKPSSLKFAYVVFANNHCWHHHADAHYRGSFVIG